MNFNPTIFLKVSGIATEIAFCPVVAFSVGSSTSAEVAMVVGAMLGSWAFDVSLPRFESFMETLT